MKRGNEVTEELAGLGSILSGMARVMPYSVPNGYFNENAERLAQSVTSEGLSWLDDITLHHNRSMPYAVPQGYFDGFAGNLMARVSAMEDVLADNPTGTSWSKTMPYSVPAGYFQGLTAQVVHGASFDYPFGHSISNTQDASDIIQTDGVRKPRRTIPLGQSFSQVRWAVAAVLLVCISLGGYISFFSGAQSVTESALASVSKEEIQDYLQHSYILDVNRIVNTTDINQLDVDSKDIEQYLNETGWDVVD